MVFKNIDDWRSIVSGSVSTHHEIKKLLAVEENEISQVIEKYPMRINPYYLSLISSRDDPLWKQAVPDIKELEDVKNTDDPLFEELQSPVPNLIHRYPDRVLFMVSDRCAMYCRFCFRKRVVGQKSTVTGETIEDGLSYIRRTTKVREVVLSGGDPLMLKDDELASILSRLREIPHVEIIRLHTRIPCTLPQRITNHLAGVLAEHHPVFVNIHFNHPNEITDQASTACGILSRAGIPLGSQTVLLKGVNDDRHTMKTLMKKLVAIRVKPYYIHHPDLVKGTEHFRTSIKTGMRIMDSLRGHLSGLCVPYYMVDLPGGKGKVPFLPQYVKKIENDKLLIKNYTGELIEYPAN